MYTTLNQAGVKASSKLRKVEYVYYPSAIRAAAFTSSKADTPSKVAELEKDSTEKVPFLSSSPPKEAEQLEVVEKKANTTKGVALNANKPPIAPQDPSKEKEVPPRMEIVLVTLPMLAKGGPKGKDQGSSEAGLSQSSKAPPKEKIVIKKK